MPWRVKFLRVCSRQCRNNLHIDSTYLQTYTDDNVQNTHTYTQYTHCTIRHTYSYHYTLYTVCTHSTPFTPYIYTYIHMQQIIHKLGTKCHGCALEPADFCAVCACSPVPVYIVKNIIQLR